MFPSPILPRKRHWEDYGKNFSKDLRPAVAAYAIRLWWVVLGAENVSRGRYHQKWAERHFPVWHPTRRARNYRQPS